MRDSSDSLRVAAQASRYSARLSAAVRRRAFRFLIASQSSGVDQGLVYRPALDFPTWSFAAARRTEKRWNLSPRDKGTVENSSIASSTAAENEFQSTFPVFQRALRWDAVEGAGILGEMLVFYQFAALVCRLMFVPQWGMQRLGCFRLGKSFLARWGLVGECPGHE